MSEKRFKSRCYEKQQNVVIYDKSDKLFDVSYRDFGDAYYLKMKLSPVIDKLNDLNDKCEFLEIENESFEDGTTKYAELCHNALRENEQLKKENNELKKQLILAKPLYSRRELERENKELKESLYAEKTNTAEVVNDYAKQFKRHSAQFSFMMDLAEDLGIDVRKLEALDD